MLFQMPVHCPLSMVLSNEMKHKRWNDVWTYFWLICIKQSGSVTFFFIVIWLHSVSHAVNSFVDGLIHKHRSNTNEMQSSMENENVYHFYIAICHIIAISIELNITSFFPIYLLFIIPVILDTRSRIR